ncbi:MAG: F0F1 ATP synthase subunit B [Burkholderiales bacterium]|nr:F0F1 ATP synthase subunit B [Phycisphaerae bacterium]
MTKRIASLFLTLAAPTLTLAAEVGHAEKSGLPPSLDQGLMTGIVTLIVFLALVVILTKFAWGPISKGLAEREAKIRRDIDEAEAARQAAEAKHQEYLAQLAKAGDEVRAILATAQADAQAAAARIKLQAQQEAEESKERTLRDIESSRRAAVAEIHQQAATLSTAIAEKILRRNLNVDDQRELVRGALEQLGSN